MPVAFNLKERARRALFQFGFAPDFPPECVKEIESARQKAFPPVEDLRHLLWSSIDNEDSRDLDQIEFTERNPDGSIRLLIGIADVASDVPAGSGIDGHAFQNTVTLYTPAEIFYLLPRELSTGITSLNENEDRLAVVIEMRVETDGTIHEAKVSHALVRNRAQLDYETVARWLEQRIPSPKLSTPELQEQLELQAETARRLIALRKQTGALTFSSYEPRAITRGGDVVDLKLVQQNRARDLIESFMIAANVASATFLKSRGHPIIERVVRAPARWDRICELAARFGSHLPPQPAPKPLADFLAARRAADPAAFRELSLSVVKLLGAGEYLVEYPDGPQTGHFGLALDDYSHSTAPNRRYADLVLQRMLLATLRGEPLPFENVRLEEIAAHCTERERAARKLERLMRKVAAAYVLRDRIGEVFPAIVTGASAKGVFVRLQHPPVEGRVVRREQGLDVGDHTRVRLVSIDPECGFIDFANELSSHSPAAI